MTTTLNAPPRLGFWRGALLALLLLAPLSVLGYLAAQLFALPFLPFSLFDWLARALPGPVITAGIDTMVSVMRALGLSVADLAKLAEGALAVGIFTAPLLLAGGVFSALHRRPASWQAGVGLALLVGAPLALIALRITGSSGAASSPLTAGLWTLFCITLWALLLTAVQRRLTKPVRAGAEVSERADRRQFMVYLGGAAALVTVIVGGGVGASLGMRRAPEEAEGETGTRWSETNALPNADATVEPAPGTRPEYTPLEAHYRIDINLTPLVIDEASWHLRVEGLLERPLELTLDDLRAYEPLHQFVTLACISNPVGGDLTSTTRWTGVPLVRLLEDWGVGARATHLRVSSADGFFEVVSLDDIRNDERIMLCYAWDGVPLRLRHGFPLRIYIPDVYGMKQPKWIERIEAIDAWEPGYWVRRGWDREAQMLATAVIDTVARDAVVGEGGQALVPVGGIAHAGARGVSRVEVRVDEGEWQEAGLREPLSDTTWVLWRFDWPFEPGEHTLTVRCFEGDGTPQLTERRPPHPSGATGLNGRQVQL